MPNKKTALFFIAALFLLFFCWIAIANDQQTTISWSAPNPGTNDISLDANRHPDLNDTKTLTIRITKNGTGITNADVNAQMTKPDSTKENFNFTETSDGNYTYDYFFDTNGVYYLDVNTTDQNLTKTTIADYFYAGNYSILITVTSNGSFLAGSTATIQFYSSVAGKPLKNATGTISIYYPDGAIFQSNKTLTESITTDGYYSYSFTAPSLIFGTYSFDANFLSGTNIGQKTANFDVNSTGDICGSGTCDLSENCSSCPQDCGACPETPSGGNTGGGGGGNGVSLNEYDAKIITWNFEKEIAVAKENQINLSVKNTGRRNTSYLVQVIITMEGETVYSANETTQEISSGKTEKILLKEKFKPIVAGTYVIRAWVFSKDKKKLFDDYIGSFDIGGTIRYDVSIECLDNSIPKGTESHAQIILLNLGNYYKDETLTWWVEDKNGKIFGKATMPIALYSGETRSLLRNVFVPENAVPGNYSFKAELDYNSQKRFASCSFTVETLSEYYSKIINDFENKLNEFELAILKKKLENYNTENILTETERIRSQTEIVKKNLKEQNLENIEGDVKRLNNQLQQLIEASQNLEKNKQPLDLLIAITALLAAIILIAFWLKKRKQKETTGNFTERLFGFCCDCTIKEKNKCQNAKEPSAVEKLFGFNK